MRKIIDLSHTIFDGLITYEGLPAPYICDFLSREDCVNIYPDGTSFQIAKIEMVSNTGTYMDCPFHRYQEGHDLSELSLYNLVDIPAICINTGDVLSIDASFFKGLDIKGKAVLVNTGWDRHFNSEKYFRNHPFLTESAALFLKEKGAKMVGIDSYNIDDTNTKNRPVHSVLLRYNILIIEHMTGLQQLPSAGFTFSAVPPKIIGVGSFPVRAYAQIDD